MPDDHVHNAAQLSRCHFTRATYVCESRRNLLSNHTCYQTVLSYVHAKLKSDLAAAGYLPRMVGYPKHSHHEARALTSCMPSAEYLSSNIILWFSSSFHRMVYLTPVLWSPRYLASTHFERNRDQNVPRSKDSGPIFVFYFWEPKEDPVHRSFLVPNTYRITTFKSLFRRRFLRAACIDNTQMGLCSPGSLSPYGRISWHQICRKSSSLKSSTLV